MKIAILGTRGIPNRHGGFEQFAEYLSVGLSNLGHNITVYSPHFHPYLHQTYGKVQIKKIYSPESLIGSAANYLYDFLCLRDALKEKFDIIYEAGYQSSSFSYLVLPIRKSIIITNMDGLEWRRAKWNYLVKKLTKLAEKIALQKSDYLISDNIGIQEYYKTTHNKDSIYLPYGAICPVEFRIDLIEKLKLIKHRYYLVIARIEPENNLDLIINAFQNSFLDEDLVIIGNTSNNYSKNLRKMFSSPKVKFLGSIYDKETLDALRFFSKGYMHGHSVGGTNPSLLEAMACRCLIISHDNPFNRSVLDDNAFYFNDERSLLNILLKKDLSTQSMDFKDKNIQKIKMYYEWNKVINDHEALFKKILKNENLFDNSR